MRALKPVAIIVAVLSLAFPVWARQAPATPQIWADRGNVSALNLMDGPAGKKQPGTHFKFIKESTAGSQPKFDVEDENGIKWKVKLGPEVKAETAATRLLWAAGYYVDDDFYRSQIQVEGMPRLARGRQFVHDNDTVVGVRLKRDRKSDADKYWSWYANPFDGTREFNGLRVMMALINNWDLKEINNEMFDDDYQVTDLGAAFGRTGNVLTRSKGVLKDYVASKFIAKATPTHVDFVMHSRPLFLWIFIHPKYYRSRSRMESIAKHIPLSDARWIGDQLAQLSGEQIRDCFRAAGFSSSEVEGYAKVVTQRIADLKKLPVTPSQSVQN
jgi:hypothetical protein